MTDPLVIYVDVDDTLTRSAGSKRIRITSVIAHVRELHAAGAELYCWSSGGAEYARSAATELGIEICFRGFLPKPQVMIDDQPPNDWRSAVCVHPNEAIGKGLSDYVALLRER